MKRVFVSTLAIILVVFAICVPETECGLLDILPDVIVRIILGWNRKWVEFKCEYDKHYPCLRKELEAYTNFMAHSANVDACNRDYALKKRSFSCGINSNSDISYDEWVKTTTYNRSSFAIPSDNNTCSDDFGKHGRRSKRGTVPSSLDWARSGIVTEVKQQGSCGSCYSFSTVAYIESQVLKRRFARISHYSSQQIVDCSESYGNNGCNGGLEGNVFRYLQYYPLMFADDYKYVGRQESCKYDKTKIIRAKVTRVYNERRVTIDYLKKLVANQGPVCVAMHASDDFLQDYRAGIYSCPQCPKDMAGLDHAVLLVGYGRQGEKEYWLIKNSWGSSWGDRGYLKIDINSEITLDVSWADITWS